MPFPFKDPDSSYAIRTRTEKSAITRHFRKRNVPKSTKGKILLATWNIANLGVQKRKDSALQIIAYILRRFDLIAVQEINDDYKKLEEIVLHMGRGFDFIMNDTAGNDERLAFIYRKSKVKVRRLVGELALQKSDYPKRTVTVNYTERGKEKTAKYKDVEFVPFDRNPFIGSFSCGKIDLTLVNAHLYFGKFGNSTKEADRLKYARRVLEIYALSRWTDLKLKSNNTYDKDIVLLGDMNVPIMNEKNSAYKALVEFGLVPVDYFSKTGFTNVSNDKTYDQLVFAPGAINDRVEGNGVFDFDNVLFSDVWRKLVKSNSKSQAVIKFNRYTKHHISDHRPLWVQLDVT